MPIKRPQRFAGIFILLAMVMAFSPRIALAHAVLLSSTPQKNVAVSGPEIAISLKYNSRVDGARSTLSLLKPDGTIETSAAHSASSRRVVCDRPWACEGSLCASLAGVVQ